ncbi:hypothetical protein QR77_20825 [Streptomyces sp. 150FB]|uniref:hypothetical protein n=1 Tax=Streptomyces sp. 150FB TaxID=1576605 RepID=UPI000588F47F|nr:hypothetical protein [Streptomyces sp. 150FB]KIF75679.1 hypothetical protein QR77_20825 [Streptomyces sp. 150FB]
MQQPIDTKAPLVLAFPTALADDVRAVLAIMPRSRLEPAGMFSVAVRGEQVAIPSRLYNDEPPAGAVASLSPRQGTVLHCLYTRHHDGMVRQRHLEAIVGAPEPWIVPFVVQLAGEYVLEILVVVRDGLRDLDTPDTGHHLAYGQFLVDNPALFARTQRRVVSYWNCYHRLSYSSFQGYPGCVVLDLLRFAASARAGQRWAALTPAGGGGGRLDGYC